MKLTITHLKAPWPAGAKVGDVIDLPTVPVWAVGKCEPSPEDAEVTVIMPEALAPEASAAARDPLAELRAQAAEHFERMKSEHASELAKANERLELTKQLAVTANDKLRAELDASQAKLSEALAANAALAEGKAQAEAKLAEALAAVPKGKAK